MQELKDLAKNLKEPTYKLGIGSSRDQYNLGWNEGQAQAAKQIEKILARYKQEKK